MPTPTIMTTEGGIGRLYPDVLSTPQPVDAGMGDEIDPANLPMAGVKLVDVCNTERFHELDRMESYFRAKQDDHKRYDWDGYIDGFAEAPIKPGWYVPYKLRRPLAQYHAARVIVKRLTGMVFGVNQFPIVRCEPDPDTEDAIKEILRIASIPTRFIEGRDLGGATRSVGFSFAFIDGKPRVSVHNAKNITVLSWIDEFDHVPDAVLEAYAYPKQVLDPKTKKFIEKTYYRVRYWDRNVEILWDPIPHEVAETPGWILSPRKVVRHDFGFTPFVWIQNLPDSCDVDGEGDYEGLECNFNEMNQVLSGVVKGTKVNVDPTLVVKMDPASNDGNIRKGSDNAIFSPGGAEYLEISGQSVKAGSDTFREMKNNTLETASVVIADPEKLAGAAQSARALEILYAPMLVQVDKLRDQYGKGLVRLLIGILRAARALEARPGVSMTQPDGTEVVVKVGVLLLPPKIEKTLAEDGTETLRFVPRTLGQSEEITLNWNPSFPPTWADVAQATTAATMANGQKPVISQRTAVQALQRLWGVTSVDTEIKQIEEDSEKALERAQKTFAMQTEPAPFDDREEE